MTERSARRPGPRTWIALAVGLALVAAIAIVVAVTGQQEAPRPAAAAADPSRSSASSEPVPTTPQAPAPGTPAPPSPEAPAESVAEPVSVGIPAIGVRSDLMRLDLNDDGTVEVPPLEPDDKAGWYQRGPAPGEVGPAVILGHVDSAAHGPGIFFELGALKAGDEVEVSRGDGTIAVFSVDRVERHPKNQFPTIEVYGNTSDAQLRLITCGGDFDSGVRSYEDNVIAFATMTGSRPA